VLSNQEGYARAREAAEKALAIDPDYAPAHARLGWIAMAADNDPPGAARHYQRALALDPTDLAVLRSAAVFLMSLGRLDEALSSDALWLSVSLNAFQESHGTTTRRQ
jgi:adenylate cyclase